MSSPIDLFRQGISTGDWEKVCEGFAAMTGERLSPPSGSQSTYLQTLALCQDAISNALDGRSVTPTLISVAKPIPRLMTPPAPLQGASQAIAKQEDDDSFDLTPAPATATRPVAASSRVNLNQFQMKPAPNGGSVASAGRNRVCRSMPFEAPQGNLWQDDGRLASQEIADSQKMSANARPRDLRDPYQPVRVQCCKCNNQYDVNPIFAPRALEKDDANSYVCDNCIARPNARD